jgi:hypothetical protein
MREYLDKFFPNRQEDFDRVANSSPWKNFPDITLHEFLLNLHKLGIINITSMHDGVGMMNVEVLVPCGFKPTPLLPCLPAEPAEEPPVENVPVSRPYCLDPSADLQSHISTLLTSSEGVDVTNLDIEEEFSAGVFNAEEDIENTLSNFLLMTSSYSEERVAFPEQHALPPSPPTRVPEKRQRTPSLSSKASSSAEEQKKSSPPTDIVFISVVNDITIYNKERFPAPETQFSTLKFNISTSSFIY